MLKLGALVQAINEGRIGLPEFQRDYDWTERDIRSLLATVAMGWPAGSLLLGRGAGFVTLRQFDEAPPLGTVEYTVLDGQQRLTSLFQALLGKGPKRYYLRINKTPETVDDIEEALVVAGRSLPNDTATSAESDGVHVPFTALLDPNRFYAWRDKHSIRGAPPKVQKKWNEVVTRAYSECLFRVSSYEFPAVILPAASPPEAVARMFERLNRNGMRLGTFDLSVARTYDGRWSLRREWESACERHSELASVEALEEDGLPVLQAIALVELGDVRQSAVLRLSADVIRRQWKKAAAATASAVGALRVACGVTKLEHLPYPSMLVLLSGLHLAGNEPSRKAVQKWFWTRSFGRAYEVASNTRLVADYRRLLRGEFATPDYVALPEQDEWLEATARTHGAAYRAILCVLSSNAPRDLASGKALDVAGKETAIASLFNGDDYRRRILGVALATKESGKALTSDRKIPTHERARLSQLVPKTWKLPNEGSQRMLKERLALLLAHYRNLVE